MVKSIQGKRALNQAEPPPLKSNIVAQTLKPSTCMPLCMCIYIYICIMSIYIYIYVWIYVYTRHIHTAESSHCATWGPASAISCLAVRPKSDPIVPIWERWGCNLWVVGLYHWVLGLLPKSPLGDVAPYKAYVGPKLEYPSRGYDPGPFEPIQLWTLSLDSETYDPKAENSGCHQAPNTGH